MRAAWLADRLGEAVAERGLLALVDDQHGVTGTGELVRTGEQIRSLAVLEGQERDRAERIAASMARIGLEAQGAAARTQAEGQRLAAALEAFAELVGLDWAEDATRRLAGRALVAAREREAAPL